MVDSDVENLLDLPIMSMSSILPYEFTSENTQKAAEDGVVLVYRCCLEIDERPLLRIVPFMKTGFFSQQRISHR